MRVETTSAEIMQKQPEGLFSIEGLQKSKVYAKGVSFTLLGGGAAITSFLLSTQGELRGTMLCTSLKIDDSFPLFPFGVQQVAIASTAKIAIDCFRSAYKEFQGLYTSWNTTVTSAAQ